MALNIATEFKRLIFLINHPVGSLYLSANTTNPNTFYGGNCGKWTQISGYYLYADTSVNNTSYTGKHTRSHTLTVNQIPSHSHKTPNTLRYEPTSSWWIGGSGGTTIAVDDKSTGNTGGGQGHSHNIATKGIIVWQRTA